VTTASTAHPVGLPGLGGLRAPIERRYEPSWATVVFVVTTVFLAIGAINSQNNLLFWAFGIAVGGLLVSGIVSGAALMGVRLERHAPGLARVGEPVRVRYRLGNEARWFPALGLVIREVAGEAREGPSLETGVGHVGPLRTATAAATFTPSGRGVLPMRRVSVSSTAPFGLLRKTLVFDCPGELVVGPRRIPLRSGVARPSGRLAGSQRADRRRVGAGEEFFALREYQAGDSPRIIAWRSSARHGELVVRQMMPPSPPRCVVRLLPINAGTPDTLTERAVALAGSAVESAAEAGMLVAFDAAWAGVSVPFRPGDAAIEGALTALAGLDVRAEVSGHRTNSEAFANSDALLIAAEGGAAGRDAGETVLAADRPDGWLPAHERIETFDDSSDAAVRPRGWISRLAGRSRRRAASPADVRPEGAVTSGASPAGAAP